MKDRIKKLAVSLLAAVLLLSGCTEQPQEQSGTTPAPAAPLSLTVAAGGEQDTLTAAYSTADGSETILYHIYENLMRWENDGYGYAALAPGQAASYTVETDYAGNSTYTFTLRSDIVWSDGQNVTAYQFEAAWRRLADPAYGSPHHALMSCIAGYDAVRAGGDSSLLEISAPDARTFVVKLNGSVPYFLEVVCASAYTMPIRTYLPENEENQFVTNGAYAVSEFSPQRTVLTKSETYYNADTVTVDSLTFVSTTGSDADYAKFANSDLDFTVDLPTSQLEILAENDLWTPESVTTTYGLLFNTLQAPFDNVNVRSAFRLVIDEQAIVDALGDFTSRPATGLIPCGITDHTSPDADEELQTQSEEESNPDPNAPPSKLGLKLPTHWDFRTHSTEIVTLSISDNYEEDCAEARALLEAAGYPNGRGFPAVEYIYENTPEGKLVAELLQSVWQEKLGVSITLRAMTDEECALMLQGETDPESGEMIAPPTFQIAAAEFTAAYNDAGAILSTLHSASPDNHTGYASPAFDILMNAAAAAIAPESYDAYLHDAEAIIMQDAPVIPIFYRGGSYALSDSLKGLYRAPNGIYFFANITSAGTQNA